MVDNLMYILDIKFSPATFGEYTEGFLRSLRERGDGLLTIEEYRVVFQDFLSWIGKSYVTRHSYVDWMTAVEANCSKEVVIATHKRFVELFDYLVDEGFLRTSPMVGLELKGDGERVHVDYTHLDSPLPLKYYYAAMQRYSLLGDDNSLRDWVIIELMYSLGVSPGRMKNVEVNIKAGAYKLDSESSMKMLELRGPTHAMATMAEVCSGSGNIFRGEWVYTPEIVAEAVRALRSVQKFGRLGSSLAPRDFVVAFCGRILEQGDDIDTVQKYTGKDRAWCEAIAHEFQELECKRMAEQ